MHVSMHANMHAHTHTHTSELNIQTNKAIKNKQYHIGLNFCPFYKTITFNVAGFNFGIIYA